MGYIGTIDQYRGVDQLLYAMRLLSKRYVLRLVGRISGGCENGKVPAWLGDLLQDPSIGPKVQLIPPVPTSQVADQIDQCDILLQPASSHILTLRYASPLKAFDYMVLGKPIIAADVPCHRELFRDGVNAILYKHNDVKHLAARITSLAEQPRLANSIARSAWEQSADYTYDARASRILELVEENSK